MRLALEKSDVPVNDLFVVEIADTVEGVGDSLSVIVPVAEVERIGLEIAINFSVEFDIAGERFAPVHSAPCEKSELIFEIGVKRRVETSAKASGTFEGDGSNGGVKTNQHVPIFKH